MKTKLFMLLAAAAAPVLLSAQSPEVTDAIAQEEAQIAQSTTTAPGQLDSRLNGEWTIYNLRGDKVTGEERPFINIVTSEGRFYGNNGCNIINGTVSSSGKSSVAFDNILSTRMMCQDAPFEYLINVTLPEIKYYTVKQYGHESYLDLENDRHQVIMVLRRHNMDFLNGAWEVTRINGEPNTDESIQMVIDIPEGRIHGYGLQECRLPSGCFHRCWVRR